MTQIILTIAQRAGTPSCVVTMKTAKTPDATVTEQALAKTLEEAVVVAANVFSATYGGRPADDLLAGKSLPMPPSN